MFNQNKKIARQIKKIPSPGQFSLDGEELEWEQCRENFAKRFTNAQNGLFFSHGVNNDENVCAFIEKTEDILIRGALQNIIKSNFYKTNLNFAIWIEPSSFWMNCPMKRSLFTMLLRCGLIYNLKNYEEALYGYQYSKITKNAVQRFMYGFTEFVFEDESFEGIGKGWASYFGNKPCDLVCEKLIMPSYLPVNKFLFGQEILWA
jgi:hypothetical protein